jgi:hypothetical protein
LSKEFHAALPRDYRFSLLKRSEIMKNTSFGFLVEIKLAKPAHRLADAAALNGV